MQPIELAARIAVAVVALLHFGFLVLEMFFWTKPLGRRVFRLSEDLAQRTAHLAANQGLYNGFLAAGLVYGLRSNETAHTFRVFFLFCVIIAGLYGAFSVKRSILWVQAFPGLIALVLVLLASRI